MPRASWKGPITVGLVNIPIKLYTAQKERSISFRLIHKTCGTPISYKRWCPKCQREVPWNEIVKGYEISKGQYVEITEEDLAKIPLKSAKVIEILGFVPINEIDPIFYKKAYYIVPEKGAEKAFFLLREALRSEGVAAIAKIAFRNKEHLAIIRPYRNVLLLVLLYYADEIVPLEELEVPEEPIITPEELKLAIQLINTLKKEFKPEEYKDAYKEALEKLIQQKMQGKILEVAEETPKAMEVLEALKQTIIALEKKKKEKKEYES